MNADEIVQALMNECDECSEMSPITGECFSPMPCPIKSAIDLIESLQPDAASYQQVKNVLSREGFSDIETMIAKYKQVMADANEIDIAKDEEMESLRSELAESQRREMAAVSDLKMISNCDYCKHQITDETDCEKADFSCAVCKNESCRCKMCFGAGHWEWRGPAENEKEDAE